MELLRHQTGPLLPLALHLLVLHEHVEDQGTCFKAQLVPTQVQLLQLAAIFLVAREENLEEGFDVAV